MRKASLALAILAPLWLAACASQPMVPVNNFGAAPVRADLLVVGRSIGGQLKSAEPGFVLPGNIPVQLLEDGKVIATQKSGRGGAFRFQGQFEGNRYAVRVANEKFLGEKSFPIETEEVSGLQVFVKRRKQ